MPSLEQSALSVALIGNPNTGKSTLFGAMVGLHQRVGNYPGVTVEKRTGQTQCEGRRFEVVDLPGLYSLAPRSRDEMVAVDVLLGRQADAAPVAAVVSIIDASNLRRNLYLLSQVLELRLPTVVALNMLDVAESRGVRVDVKRLEKQLGVPVVPMQAHRRVGIAELKAALAAAVDRKPAETASPLPAAIEEEVSRLESVLAADSGGTLPKRLPRYLIQRLVLDVGGYLQDLLLPPGNGEVREELQRARTRLVAAGHAVPGVETEARYGWVDRVLEGVATEPEQYRTTSSDRIDGVLTHRLWGTLIFAVVMVVIFQSVFSWSEPLMAWIERTVAAGGTLIEARMTEGALRSLLVDGVIGGVGGVLVFLPQIMILFLFIAVLEDCGYMARAAYLMDRLMSRVGLSGKSFIPMLSSFACAIPGIMAARVIEDERDRLTTILVAPLMTCSARLPIYALLIAAFIPAQTYLGGLLGLRGLTLSALYLLGIATAILAALVLKRSLLRGTTPPFVMELPSYKWPSPRTILYRVVERALAFLRCAGTMILAVSILIWAAIYYPHDESAVEGPFRPQQQRIEAELDSLDEGHPRRAELLARLNQIEREIAGEYQRQSFLGRIGRTIEPVFLPMGWDWRIGSAVIASFPAREIVVATLNVIFDLGENPEPSADENFAELGDKLRRSTWEETDRPLFNIPVALSIMVFFALCAQCAATLAVIRRETNSWRWPAFTFAYMTTLAYLGAVATYQIGMWVGRFG